MGKFYGKVGYVKSEETRPDIWEETTTEQDYYGDVLGNVGLWRSSDKVVDNLELNCEISILADPYAFENYSYIKYVVHNGAKWKVNSVRPNYPCLVLQLGGVYNG